MRQKATELIHQLPDEVVPELIRQIEEYLSLNQPPLAESVEETDYWHITLKAIFFRPVLAIDFDGVLHSHTSRRTTASEIPDPPVPGALEFVKQALPHFKITVVSSRLSEVSGRDAVINWLAQHEFPIERMAFSVGKPPAFVTLDDRAMTFTGSFPSPEDLLEFIPWNKKQQE